MRIHYTIAIVLLSFAFIGASKAQEDRLETHLRLENNYIFWDEQEVEFSEPTGESELDVGNEESVSFVLAYGCRINPVIRNDISYTYVAETEFEGPYLHNGVATGVDGSVEVRTHAFMYNVFADFGEVLEPQLKTDGVVNPYVGAGIGVALHDLTNIEVGSSSVGDEQTTEFAWHVSLGVEFMVSDHFLISVGYRYLDFGTAESDDQASAGSIATGLSDPLELDLAGHALTLGIRIEF